MDMTLGKFVKFYIATGDFLAHSEIHKTDFFVELPLPAIE